MFDLKLIVIYCDLSVDGSWSKFIQTASIQDNILIDQFWWRKVAVCDVGR